MGMENHSDALEKRPWHHYEPQKDQTDYEYAQAVLPSQKEKSLQGHYEENPGTPDTAERLKPAV